MYILPKTITIEGQSFAIRNDGDFRMVLDCFSVMDDDELNKDEKAMVMMMLFYEGLDTIEDFSMFPDINKALKEMYKFFSCGKDDMSVGYSPKLIDWDKDSDLIFAAVNNVANKEVRAEDYLHWWTFIGYYMSVGESALSTIVGIRNKIVRGKKLEKHEIEFRRTNPQYFNWNATSSEKREADELARQLWNSDRR